MIIIKMRFFVLILLLACFLFPLYSRPRSGRNENPPSGESSPAAAEGSPAESSPEKPSVAEAVFPPDIPPGSGEGAPPDLFPEIIIKDLPKTPRPILGRGELGQELLSTFLLSENKNADREFVERLAGFYIAEAESEGINHDVAFAQMCLETGFLRFGGLVKAEMNNFCGLGSIGPGEPGEHFPSVQIGVRAHIQHLKAYASDLPLRGELVDPRYRLVRKGSAPVIQGLAGTWAADKQYAEKIEAILQRLYRFKERVDIPASPGTS